MPRILPGKIDTVLALRADGRLLVGRERINLLEAVIKYGSITKAAEIAGFSYKTAWDAVNAINNILPRPAFITRTGGPRGGGAEVTEEGRRLIRTFRRLEEKLGEISESILEEGLDSDRDFLFWGFCLKLSIRNAYHCRVVEVVPAPVNVKVRLSLAPQTEIAALVTNASVKELRLNPGRPVVAMVNPSAVFLWLRNHEPRVSACNRIPGTVLQRMDSALNAEVIVQISGNKTMTAVIDSDCPEAEAIVPGAEVFALFNSSNVILGGD